MSFRKRPSLSDRMRGKTGAEIINELRQELDQDRKRFFENSNWGSTPTGSTFSRRRFPFDDEEEEVFSHQRPDWQAHLDEIANRHPEFADQLRNWSSSSSQPGEFEGQPATAEPPPTKVTDTRNCEEKQRVGGEAGSGCGELGGGSKLSATVPDMQQQQQHEEEERAQRAKSAPPTQPQPPPPASNTDYHQHNQQQAPFVSRVEINHQPQQREETRQPTVRHIPIYVEGRDELILPKEAQDHRATGGSSWHNVSTSATSPPPPPPPQPQQYHQQKPRKVAEQQTLPKQRSMESPSASSEATKPSQTPPPQQPHQPPPPLSQIAKVHAVQEEVKELKEKVEQFAGNSKTDKEYIYLDEMLTRNLLKLDDIETEGREEVRAARKDVIRLIQRCISILDSKAAATATAATEEKTEPKIATGEEEEEEKKNAESSVPDNDPATSAGNNSTEQAEAGATPENPSATTQHNNPDNGDPPPPQRDDQQEQGEGEPKTAAPS